MKAEGTCWHGCKASECGFCNAPPTAAHVATVSVPTTLGPITMKPKLGESYAPGWARVVLMVSPAGEMHAVGGDQESGPKGAEMPYIGLERILRRLSANSQPAEELKRLAESGEPDTSDIPEVTDWSKAERGKFYRGPTESESVRPAPKCPKCGRDDRVEKSTQPKHTDFCKWCGSYFTQASSPRPTAQFFPAAPREGLEDLQFRAWLKTRADAEIDGKDAETLYGEYQAHPLPSRALPDARLCYVEGDTAYFTTQELSKQWGDDWNDAPYEHNAETPYEPHKGHDYKEGEPEPWRITTVKFDGPFVRPCDGFNNSPYSVQQINAGAVAWLVTERWNQKIVAIQAGTTLAEFKRKVAEAGGKIYEDSSALQSYPSPQEPEVQK